MITFVKEKLDERKYNKSYSDAQIRTMKAKILKEINTISIAVRIANSNLIQVAHNAIIKDNDHIKKVGSYRFQERIYHTKNNLPTHENKKSLIDPEFIRINDLINKKRITSDTYLDILYELKYLILDIEHANSFEINKISAERVYDKYTQCIQDVYTRLTPILNKIHDKKEVL